MTSDRADDGGLVLPDGHGVAPLGLIYFVSLLCDKCREFLIWELAVPIVMLSVCDDKGLFGAYCYILKRSRPTEVDANRNVLRLEIRYS